MAGKFANCKTREDQLRIMRICHKQNEIRKTVSHGCYCLWHYLHILKIKDSYANCDPGWYSSHTDSSAMRDWYAMRNYCKSELKLAIMKYMRLTESDAKQAIADFNRYAVEKWHESLFE